MNAQVTVETVAPPTAALWLENKWEEQRPIRPNHVARLAADIRTGKFRLTCDALCMVKGRIANGQHRLAAVVMAKKSAQFIVMRCADEELFKVIDSGAKRSVADALGVMPYANIVAACTRMILSYDNGAFSKGGEGINYTGVKVPITRMMILDYIEKHMAALSEQAAFVGPLYFKGRICGTAPATALLHIASRKHPDKAREFIRNVYLGETVDASKDFRDRMIRQLGARGRFRAEYIFALLIKAWKSFLAGTRPGTLKMAEGEEFPKIL